MNVEALKRSMRNDDCHHKDALPNKFLDAISQLRRALRAIKMFKDEYLLDFINVEELRIRDAADIDKRMVEQVIVHNAKSFIMEFWR